MPSTINKARFIVRSPNYPQVPDYPDLCEEMVEGLLNGTPITCIQDFLDHIGPRIEAGLDHHQDLKGINDDNVFGKIRNHHIVTPIWGGGHGRDDRERYDKHYITQLIDSSYVFARSDEIDIVRGLVENPHDDPIAILELLEHAKDKDRGLVRVLNQEGFVFTVKQDSLGEIGSEFCFVGAEWSMDVNLHPNNRKLMLTQHHSHMIPGDEIYKRKEVRVNDLLQYVMYDKPTTPPRFIREPTKEDAISEIYQLYSHMMPPERGNGTAAMVLFEYLMQYVKEVKQEPLRDFAYLAERRDLNLEALTLDWMHFQEFMQVGFGMGKEGSRFEPTFDQDVTAGDILVQHQQIVESQTRSDDISKGDSIEL